MTAKPVPVGGKIMTRPVKWLLALFAIGVVLLAWRFAVGLGAPTALNDGYAWGLWIAFDVVTGTALGCGGYAMAILVYVFNRGQYHPLVRPALVTSALGYTLGGIGVIIDIGRYWWVWKLPVFFWTWNLNSILLEVALCIMLYMFVLWIELSPAFLEKWAHTGTGALKNFAIKASRVLERSMVWLIALGLLLPTMHQSSLGSLMLLAGPRLHPLWHTPWLPFLFLISCLGMGYGVVVMETSLAMTVFKRKRETDLLRRMSPVIVFTLLLYSAVRIVDIIWRGKLGYITAFDQYSLYFLVEMALFLVPAFMLLFKGKTADMAFLFRSALLLVLGGAVYRFGTYLIGFNPGEGWQYFPAVPEILVTVGLVSLEIVAYIAIVKTFPILSGAAPATSET